MRYLFLALSSLALVAAFAGNARSQAAFDLKDERDRMWAWLADQHVRLGDDYKRVGLFPDARAQYDRARLLVPNHRNAMRGLGFRQERGEWVEHEPLPARPEVPPAELPQRVERMNQTKRGIYERCARHIQRVLDLARRAGDEPAARILAGDLLYYEPDNRELRELRKQVEMEGTWVPYFAKEWRDAGKRQMDNATEGEAIQDEDPQATTIGTTFHRRGSSNLQTRTSYGDQRARDMHRAGQASYRRALEVLGRSDAPFVGGRRYTITHLRTQQEYQNMVDRVLRLQGDQRDLVLRLSGTGQANPWGYLTRATTAAAADDSLCGAIAIIVMHSSREQFAVSQPWVQTGFSYFITSHTLGTTMTVRYTLVPQGHTATSDSGMPDLRNRSGTPESLREVAWNMVTFNKDIPLSLLVHTSVNDMSREHAAKSFSLMEFFFHKYPEKARAWMRMPAPEAGARLSQLEEAFGLPHAELEGAWRLWVQEYY